MSEANWLHELVRRFLFMNATNIITLWKRQSRGRRYWSKPDYPFIPQVKAEPEYWARRGWKLSPTGRAVLRIKP
jgi:hypothetical protein